MAYTFLFTSHAKQDIAQLDSVVQKRLSKKFANLAQSDDIGVHAKKLTNHRAGDYRIRIGDYRVICDIDAEEIIVLRIRHRREVYRD